MFVHGMEAIRGKAAIQHFYAGFLHTMRVRDISYCEPEVEEAGDLAVETAGYTLFFSRRAHQVS